MMKSKTAAPIAFRQGPRRAGRTAWPAPCGRGTGGFAAAGVVAVTASLMALAAIAAERDKQRPTGSVLAISRPLPWVPEDGASQGLFRPGTLIPQLAMGVRRIDDPPEQRDRRMLDLWEQPGTAAASVAPLARVPLFRPLFVYARRTDGGVTWHLLGDAYAKQPMGWADGRHLHQLDGRYAYQFNTSDGVSPGVHLYKSPDAAYEALEAQSQAPPTVPLEGVVVLERITEDRWNSPANASVAPFVELREPRDRGGHTGADLTDTTLTFPMQRENRLIRLGAVAGGPVDAAVLAGKRREAAVQAGIAIVFVIDETFSMQPFFGGVADFIDKNLDLDKNAVNVRVAVSWYSDVEKSDDTPYEVRPLEPLNGPDIEREAVARNRRRIVDAVRGRKERIIRGDGAQERELIYRGLIAAVDRAGFMADENKMVFVIGDAADRSTPGELAELQRHLADLIQRHGLQVGFVQVGSLGPDFADQARSFRETLPPDRREAVIVQGEGVAPLQRRIAELQTQMANRRSRLFAEIAEMETRNRYSEPGPALLVQMTANGIDRATYDRDHWQFLVPAWGWLYHPQRTEATPQLRELIFLTHPETDALKAALGEAITGLEGSQRIDADAARRKFVQTLTARSGHTAIAAAADAAWQSLPADDRTLGRFLRDGLGLRVRNPLLFHRGAVNPRTGPVQLGMRLLQESRDRMAVARPPEVPWLDAWQACP